MPKKPRTPCRFRGCPELTEDKYCEKHRRLESHYYNKYKRDPDNRYDMVSYSDFALRNYFKYTKKHTVFFF